MKNKKFLICQFKVPVFVAVVQCCFPFSSIGQENRTPNFFGINPSITVEPFYEEGEMDINILPLVYQRPYSKRLDLRLITIMNLGIRNTENDISHFGVEAAIPIYFKQKEEMNSYSKGFYVAPIVGVTRNRLENHNNIGLWVEPGYNLLFDNSFAMTFGLQLGGTYFIYDQASNEWGPHFGIKIIIGKWF